MSNNPNIFNYATKELSQDAFLTWLINWASSAYNGNALHDCAVEFINLMLPRDEEIEVESVKTWQQWKHIDIWASINDKVAIIIEDKIGNSIGGMDNGKDQLDNYEEETQKWCDENNYKCYFVFLKTGIIKQEERNYLGNRHKNWKIIDREGLLKVLNKYVEKIDNNIFCDFVECLNKIETASNMFLTKNITEWDYATREGFYYRLDKAIKERTGWGYVNNPAGGFLGFWWHWVRCNNKLYDYYLQLQDMELYIRIDATDVNKDDRVNIRNEAIEFLEQKFTEDERNNILKPRRLSCGNYMAIKHIKQEYWLVKNANGLVNIDETIQRLKEISSILDRCK